ncbi:thymidylate kinase [Quercus suber]|uniref:dTMP kinase n=1 Tax=Quercus suber TaxID=58331 RepID=A0AAW0K851_QUESU
MPPTFSLSPYKALNFGALAFGKLSKFELKFPSKCSIRQIRMAAKTHESVLSGSNSESKRGALIVLEGLDRSGKTSQSSKLLAYLEGLGHSAELWRFPDRSTNVGQMISMYLSNKSQLDDHTIHLLFSANRWEKRTSAINPIPDLASIVCLCQSRGTCCGFVQLLGNLWRGIPSVHSGKGVSFVGGYGAIMGSVVSRCNTLEHVIYYLVILLMETKLKTGTTLIVDRYSYSGVAFSSAKGLALEWCKAPEIGLLAPDLVLYLDIQPEIIDACQPIEDIEKQLQEIVLDCVMTCQKGKPLSNLWSG